MIPAVRVLWVQNPCKGVQRSKLLHLERIFAFLWSIIFILWLMNTMHQSQQFEKGTIFCIIKSLFAHLDSQPPSLLPAPGSVKLFNPSLCCLQPYELHLLHSMAQSSLSYVSMMSPLCRYFTRWLCRCVGLLVYYCIRNLSSAPRYTERDTFLKVRLHPKSILHMRHSPLRGLTSSPS